MPSFLVLIALLIMAYLVNPFGLLTRVRANLRLIVTIAISIFFLIIFPIISIIILLLILIAYFVDKNFQGSNNMSIAIEDINLQEALDILAVKEDASEREIIKAYHEMMKRNHPDTGGSNYLAEKINLAKEFLLKRKKQ